jgi:hypothetical protein
MTTKKVSTKRPAKGKAAQAIDALDLPGLLSAVMKHPDTPTLVYNALGDALTGMGNHIDYNTPEMVGRALAAYAAAEAKRKGGAK